MSTIGHVATETSRWMLALVVVALIAVAVIVAAMFVGAFAWYFLQALWGERLWLAAIGAGFAVALAWAAIKGE